MEGIFWLEEKKKGATAQGWCALVYGRTSDGWNCRRREACKLLRAAIGVPFCSMTPRHYYHWDQGQDDHDQPMHLAFGSRG